MKTKRLTKEELVRIIREEFPRLRFSNATINNKGWDHTTLLLDNKHVFRFPKDDSHMKKIRIEMQLLNMLSERIPTRIPKYELIGKNHVFGGYKLIEGKELTKAAFRKLTESQKKDCAKRLGEFLTFLHDFPTNKAMIIGLKEDWPLSEERKEYEKRKKFIFSVLSEKECSFVKIFAKKYFSMKIPQKLTIIHNDICDNHILIKNGKISGIIDFGDSSLGDPAKDFAWLWELGDRFALNVLRSYDRSVDREFLVRSHYYNFAGTIGQLYHGVADKKRRLLRDSLRRIKGAMKDNHFLGE